MAREEATGLRSPKAQVAVVALAAVALAVAYWQFIYGPLAEDEQRLQANFKKLEKENQALSEEERVQNDMIKCKPELDALNRENELMLPAEAEPVAFLKNLSSMAATAGLEQGPTKMLAESDVQAPPAAADEKKREAARGNEPVPCWEKVPGLQADAAKATFVRVPFVLEVRGTFHQLMRYFWMVHEHANAGRIITIEDLSLTDPEPGTDGIVMTAKFIAVGFREPDSAAGAAPEAEAAPKGGKGQIRDATAKREAQVEAASGAAGAASKEAAPAAPATPTPAEAPADKAQSGVDRITKPEAQ
jgi:Tfp pilus assembly protein PilO